MTMFDNIITAFVLLAIFVIAYCRIKKTTVKELIIDVREAFQDKTEEEVTL